MENAKPLIFVVDDDESVRKSLRRLLRSVGFEVEAFPSGSAFLSRTPRPQDGVVILDLRMPVLNGLDVQRELRCRRSMMRVIFITAHEDEQARDAAMAGGAMGYLRKPFDQSQLLELVEAAVTQMHGITDSPEQRTTPPIGSAGTGGTNL